MKIEESIKTKIEATTMRLMTHTANDSEGKSLDSHTSTSNHSYDFV